MKILMITWACDLEDVSEPGVSAKWVQEISKDHDVTVFSISKPERYGCVKEQFPDIDVIEWQDIRVPKSLERFRAIVKPGYLPYYFKARSFLKKFLKDNDFDVIHHLSPFAWRYPSPAIGLGIPLVKGPVAGGLKTPSGLVSSSSEKRGLFSLLRSTDDFRIKFDPILRRSYAKIDHVLMAAPYVQELLSSLAIQSCSVEVELGLSEQPKVEQVLVRTKGQVQFLFVGRVIPTKGLLYAIKAFAQSDAIKRSHLNIVGDGEDLQRCKDEVQKLGIENKISFLGWCSRAEVEKHYQNADIFLFPSYREPTGGVLLEAMSYGLPSITCSYGGVGYMIDETCGIKISPKSESFFVSGLSDAIDELGSNDELRERLGRLAKLRANTFFNWQEKRKRMSKLYAEVAKQYAMLQVKEVRKS